MWTRSPRRRPERSATTPEDYRSATTATQHPITGVRDAPGIGQDRKRDMVPANVGPQAGGGLGTKRRRPGRRWRPAQPVADATASRCSGKGQPSHRRKTRSRGRPRRSWRVTSPCVPVSGAKAGGGSQGPARQGEGSRLRSQFCCPFENKRTPRTGWAVWGRLGCRESAIRGSEGDGATDVVCATLGDAPRPTAQRPGRGA